jgi:hypothetical protein
MATEAPLYTLTLKATGTVTKQRFVEVTGVHATAAAKAIGVSRVDAVTGDNFGAHTLGTAIVESGGAIAIGAAVEVGANGKAVTNAVGVKVGRALTAASADGDLIEVYLIPSA